MYNLLAVATTPAESVGDVITIAGDVVTFLTTSPLALFFWAPVIGIVLGVIKKNKKA